METMSISAAKASIEQLLERVVATGEPVMLTRRRVPEAAIVPWAWLEVLQAAAAGAGVQPDPGSEA